MSDRLALGKNRGMRNVASYLCLGLVAVAPCSTQVARNGKAVTVIVTQVGATPAELHAAKDLRDTLSKITGAEIELRNDATEAPKGAIVVGQGPIAKRLLPKENWDALGIETILLASSGRSFVVAGGRPRGTVYAVNRLLNSLGVRWWTPWATQIPHLANLVLKDQHRTETPVFEYRDPYWFHSFDADWAVHNYDNGFNTRIAEDRGGKVEYDGFVHTYFPLVPPNTFFKTHPEWYSLINGKRTAENAQLCTTNPELRDFVVEQIRQKLRNNSLARIVSVSQNDCYRPCQCDNCRALAKREGSDSALVLDLANYVGEKIEKEFPLVAVDTLAYQWSRKPPLSMRPRPNVIVRLCSIECSFSWALDEKANESFSKDVDGWSKLANRLYIWDYCTDFANYIQPQPDYFTFGRTLRFLSSHGAKGLFEEGAYQSTGADMAELKAWALAQLMWNPNQDDDALVHEFLTGYYGDSAAPIYRYLQLMQERAKTVHLSFAAPVTTKFLDFDTLAKAEALWDEALRLARTPEVKWRVAQAHLSTQYVWLSRWDELRAVASKGGYQWPVTSVKRQLADEWLATATGLGPSGWSPITAVDEGGQRPAQFISRVRS